MTVKSIALSAIIFLSTAISACSESPKTVHLNLHYIDSDAIPAETHDTQAQSAIAEAATSADHSLAHLSAIQLATHPTVRLDAPAKATNAAMARKASLNWNGPLVPLVKAIAKSAGYQIKILGHEPAIPVLVNIQATNESLATILRNVAYQANPNAAIESLDKHKIIEIRYQ